MKIGMIDFGDSTAELSVYGWESDSQPLQDYLNVAFGKSQYSPAHGAFGIKLIQDAAKQLGGKPTIYGREKPEASETSQKLASFFGITLLKESDCGANAEGGGGFQPGNSCGDDEGDGTNTDDDNWHPDKDAPLPDDGPSQHDDMFHNIKTDPTGGDRAELWQYAKDVATLKLRKDSLLLRAVKELTTNPAAEDQMRAVKFAGDVLTLKPARDFVTGKNRKENPASDDLAIITGGVKKVVNGTVGNLFRLLARGAKASMGTGEALPKDVLNRVISHPSASFARSFTKAAEADQSDIVDQVTAEIMDRIGDDEHPETVQSAILDVMEEVLAGEFPPKADQPDVQKSGGISGTTGESGGFLMETGDTGDSDSEWIHRAIDFDDCDSNDIWN